MVRRLFLLLHRITGIVAALFLAMWFISGLVLIYKPFPSVNQQDIYQRMESISELESEPDLAKITALIPTEQKIKGLYINQFDGQQVINIRTTSKLYRYCADTLQQIKPIGVEQIRNIASKWSNGAIARIDTLDKRELWIMYSRYIKEMPIYKVYFDDSEKHQLYISSRTGEVQQFSSRSQRFWAWFGAIPHKLYIPALRENSTVWSNTITTIAVICLITSLAGIYLGVETWIRNYSRTGKSGTPYRKKWYRWHHIAGLIFGVFVVSWSLSGTMSIKKIPQWIVKSHREIPAGIKGKPLPLEAYKLGINQIINSVDSVKQIEWSYFHNRPVMEVVAGRNIIYLDASGSNPAPLALTSAEIESAVRKNHDDAELNTELLEKADNYYVAWNKELPLPVYRVSVADEDNSTYYINPATGEYRFINDNRRAKRWLFHFLHYFNHQWLIERPILWTAIIWTTVLGCITVSVSGVWLSWRYIERKFKRRCRK